MTNHAASEHSKEADIDNTVSDFGDGGYDSSGEDEDSQPPPPLPPQEQAQISVGVGEFPEQDEGNAENAIRSYFGSDIIDERPELIRLLQDNVVILDEQMDRDDEALDELAESLMAADEESRERSCDIAPLPIDDVGVAEEADATGGNGKRPLSYFSGCLKGEFSQLYFMQEHNDPNGGIRGIAFRAQYRVKRLDGLATLKAAKYLFSTLDNLVNLPRADQDRFLNHMRLTFDYTSSSPRVDGLDMPASRERADNLCLKGTYSMFANIPTEKVIEIDRHACIGLSDLIERIFAQGTDFSFMKDPNGVNLDGFNGTPRAADLLEELQQRMENGDGHAIYFGHLMFWSDSFLRCFSRQRDNSYWIFVVRVMPPEGCATSSSHTFCLAMGSSKECHDKVIAHYMKEVSELMKGKMCYYGKEGIKDKIYVCLGLAAYIADTPERNAAEHSLHMGNYGLRSGHAGRVDPDTLPSCKLCFKRMIEEILTGVAESPGSQCHRCCNWDMFSNSRANRSDKTEGTNYPQSVSANNPHCFPANRCPVASNQPYLACMKQDFKGMESAAKGAAYEYGNKNWDTQAQVKYYLGTLGIDAKVQTWVCHAGKKIRKGETVTDSDYIPSLWQLPFSIELFIETAMHLLGHGIFGSILELTDAVFTEHKLWSDFCKFANVFMRDIANFRLDWCHLKTLPKASWLAEDGFGYGRMMLFLYGQYFLQKDIPNSCMLGATLTSLKQLLCSCNVMVSLLMSKEHLPENGEEREAYLQRLDRHIKIFLSCCHRFSRSYYDSTVYEFWFGKSNFISLLNLPDQIAKFGPLRYYWDGTFERYIQGPKKVLKSVRKNPGSLMVKMRILQAFSFMDKIRSDLGLDVSVSSDSDKRYMGVYIFPKKIDILDRLAKGQCLSGYIVLPDDEEHSDNDDESAGEYNHEVYVPYSTGHQTCSIVVLKYDPTNVSSNGCGLNYSQFAVIPTDDSIVVQKKDLRQLGVLADKYCLMLPYCKKNERFQCNYSVITDEYHVLRRDGDIGENELCHSLFTSNNL